MCPLPSANTAKSPRNSRLSPARACCFTLESLTQGSCHRNTQEKDPAGLSPIHTISIHLIRRQAEGSGNNDGLKHL